MRRSVHRRQLKGAGAEVSGKQQRPQAVRGYVHQPT